MFLLQSHEQYGDDGIALLCCYEVQQLSCPSFEQRSYLYGPKNKIYSNTRAASLPFLNNIERNGFYESVRQSFLLSKQAAADMLESFQFLSLNPFQLCHRPHHFFRFLNLILGIFDEIEVVNNHVNV